jgi:DNA polymerase (family X)
VALFQTIPGVGPTLARRVHDVLHVETLEALETAIYDRRLHAVPGIGRRRAELLRSGIAERLGRVRPRLPIQRNEPDIATLLDVDREYREKAAADLLPKIAPKRFNPTHEAWLHVLHTTRAPWIFTALFSNTARAHELGRVKDWVVVYFHSGKEPEAQRTIVTEKRGALASKRVVRGREAACREHYEGAPSEQMSTGGDRMASR